MVGCELLYSVKLSRLWSLQVDAVQQKLLGQQQHLHSQAKEERSRLQQQVQCAHLCMKHEPVMSMFCKQDDQHLDNPQGVLVMMTCLTSLFFFSFFFSQHPQ